VPPLLYADDLALLAQSIDGLQRQLDHLQTVATAFGLVINVGKTKLMALGPSAPAPSTLPPLTIAGAPLEWVPTFRYLGLRVHYRHGFSSAAEERHASALSKYYAMVRQCKAKGVEDANSLCLLFDSLVGSVLGYGGPIWAPDVYGACPTGSDPPDDPTGKLPLAIERLQRQFMRHCLGLPKRTPSLPLLVESQRTPVVFHLYKHAMRFLHHLLDTSAFPVDSLVRRALAASADYYAPPSSWLHQFQVWSDALGVPFDLSVFIPPELSSSFAVTHSVGEARPRTRSVARAAAAPLQPLPSTSSALSRVYARWVATRVTPALISYPSLVVPSVPSSWKRRLPALYLPFPRTRERTVIAAARLYLPVCGRLLFSSSSTDLRTLDPDPLIAADITSLAHSFHIDPTSPIPTLLASPPKTLPAFLRTVSAYLHVRYSNASRSDLLRKFPQLPI
jgi:hypothetical protein